MKPPPLNKTLVIQPLPGIGDMVWFFPHLRALAAQSPDGKVSLLAKSSSQVHHLLGHESLLDEVIWIDPKNKNAPLTSIFHFTKRLKQRGFSQVWILHHSPSYALAAFMAGIPQRCGYGFSWQKIFLTSRNVLDEELSSAHAMTKATRFLTQHQIPLKAADQILTANLKVQKIIEERFKNYPRPWISFGIGATEASRCWPLASFSELAAYLHQPGKNTIFLNGAPHESEAAFAIQSGARNRHKDAVAATDLSLDQTIALINACDFFVGNDSGLMNIAACLGLKTVGLFGQGFVLDYRPNLLAVTPKQTPARIENIRVDQVINFLKAKQLIADKSTASA